MLALQAYDVQGPTDHLATPSGYYSRDSMSRMVMLNPSIYALLSDSAQETELMAVEPRIPAMPAHRKYFTGILPYCQEYNKVAIIG